ncbi:MAG: GntR family transcriptional regulator [Ruminococcaceae bacterium]|nr:GntR family transcriptional regulator [Oscillospiraceae bacterium]MBQ4048841.1 GntR family transcriptional regulator [Clostridia bacterium]
MYTAIKTESDGGPLASRVFQKIEKEILDGTLPSGESLTEAKLCERFGVSRTPVREALFQLEQEGLVQIKHNKGAVVVGISEKDIEDIYTIRMHIEGLASRWAAERITDEEKKQLMEVVDLEMFYAFKENVEQCRTLDHSFHDGLYTASRSKPLRNTLRSFHNYIGRARAQSFKTGDRIKIAATEHKAILDAIIAGDGDLAEQLTKDHIAKAKANLLRYFHGSNLETES